MKSLARPELPTASFVSSQAPNDAMDNSALYPTHPESTYKSGKVVQTNGATSNFWLMIVAIALCIVAYFAIINSCVRFVTQKTEMPPDIQAFFSEKYKADPEFAKEVDKLASSN